MTQNNYRFMWKKHYKVYKTIDKNKEYLVKIVLLQ
jgi:hypothetical protein